MHEQFWIDLLGNTKQSNGHIIANCPVCNEDGRHFYGNIATGLWDCKKCQASGNAWTFLRDYRQMQNAEIYQHLEQYGIISEQPIEGQVIRKPKIFDKKIIDLCCSQLTEQRLNEFALERGLSVEILKKHNLGFNDSNEFTLPVFDEQGNIRNILRKKDGSSTISSKDGEGVLFGIDDLISESKEIFIVEGPWSALALKERGYKAVGTCGAGVLKDEQLPFFKDKEVFLIPDNDGAGNAGVEKISQKLKSVAKNIYVIDLPVPEKKDVRDYFKDGGIQEQFDDLINKARQNIPKAEEQPEQKSNHLITLDYLPEGFLKDYVRFVSPLTEAPIQYHIATALALAGTVLGRNVFLHEGATTYYPNLYLLIVGESGLTRKSTALNLVYEFLPVIDSNYILGATMSVEALLDNLRIKNCRIIIYDELKQLIVNEEKSYGKGIVPFFTSIWSNPPMYRVDTKNIEYDKRIIEKPTLNILAASTPDWLQLKEADVLGGFLGRFLPICSSNEKKRIAIRERIDSSSHNRIIEALRRISSIKGEYAWSQEARGIFAGVNGSKGLYDEIRDDFDQEQNKAMLQPYWSRIDTHLRKLAIIFDACSNAPTFTITKTNLMRAYCLMGFITDYYRDLLSRLNFSWEGKKEMQIVDKLKASPKGEMQHSDLMRDLNIDSANMKKLISTLEEKELIESFEVKGVKKPKKFYRLKSRG